MGAIKHSRSIPSQFSDQATYPDVCYCSGLLPGPPGYTLDTRLFPRPSLCLCLRFPFGLAAKRKIFTNIHSSIIHNGQNAEDSKCPSTDEWINKLWNIHTIECYAVRKKSEVLIYARI